MATMSSREKTDNRKYFTDIIGDDYKNWTNDEIILNGGTGSGKTRFCIEVLIPYATSQNKTVLYFCNRTKLLQQSTSLIQKLRDRGQVDILIYQSLEQLLHQTKEFTKKYDYIIVDECHYFTQDSLFNDFTDLSYGWLMKQKDSVRIYMSATAEKFFEYLRKGRVPEQNYYYIPVNYSHVTDVYFYRQNVLTTLLDEILANDDGSKAIVFMNSAKRMMEMYKRYGSEANYYCSKKTQNKELEKIREDDCIIHVKDLITFKKRILFTTTALDCGVDMKDRNIKYIFSEILDIDTARQCLGRKRPIDASDTCTFYLKIFSSGIQGILNNIQHQIEPCEAYIHDKQRFYDTYCQDRNLVKKYDCFYTETKDGRERIGLNRRKYAKLKIDRENLLLMKTMGYENYMLSKLGIKDKVRVLQTEAEDDFLKFLNSLIGKKLFKEDREQVKKMFISIGAKLRYTGINSFNGILDDKYPRYRYRFWNIDKTTGRVLSENHRTLPDGKPNPNRNKKYWLLM